MGPLLPLFWTSGDVCPGFQSQGGFPRLRASSPAHNGFLRFTSGATPAFSTNSGVHCISVLVLILILLIYHYVTIAIFCVHINNGQSVSFRLDKITFSVSPNLSYFHCCFTYVSRQVLIVFNAVSCSCTKC